MPFYALVVAVLLAPAWLGLAVPWIGERRGLGFGYLVMLGCGVAVAIVARSVLRVRSVRAARPEGRPEELVEQELDSSASPKNRYTPAKLIADFEQRQLRVFDKLCWVFVGDEHDGFMIEFPFTDAEHVATYRATIVDILSAIAELDNLVQDCCISEHMPSGLPASRFELELMSMQLTDDELMLNYSGIRVNTSWSARFMLVDGRWLASRCRASLAICAL